MIPLKDPMWEKMVGLTGEQADLPNKMDRHKHDSG